MKTFQWLESIDRRVLAAVRFINDIDGSPISGPLEIVSDPSFAATPGEVRNLRIRRNRFGLHILHFAPGFEDYCTAFSPEPPAHALPPRIAHLRVSDTEGRYLPAAFAIRLPRALADAESPDSASAPVEVRLLPAPNAPLADGWAVLRVTVWIESTPGLHVPLRGALLRVLRHEDGVAVSVLSLLGRGQTDWRPRADGSLPSSAEALVAIHGIPIVQFSTAADGSVLSASQRVRLELRHAPAFDATAPDALPDLEALSAATPGAGVESHILPALPAVELCARLRAACTLLLTASGELQLS